MLNFLGITNNKMPLRTRYNVSIYFWEGLAQTVAFELANPATFLPGLVVILLRSIPELEGYEYRIGMGFRPLMVVGFSFFPLIGSYWAMGRRQKLPLALKFTLVGRLPWFLISASLFFFAMSKPFVCLVCLYGCFLLFAVAMGLSWPLSQDLVALTVPENIRGRLMGWRSTLGRLLAMGLLGVLAGSAKSLDFPTYYVLLFFGAGIGSTASWFILRKLKERRRAKPKARTPFKEFLGSLAALVRSDKDLKSYLTYRLLAAFFAFATPGLVTMRASQGATIGEVATMSTLFAVAIISSGVIFSIVWGWIGDRWGWKIVNVCAMTCTGLGFGVALWADDQWGFFVAHFLLATGQRAVIMSAMTFILEFGPKGEKTATAAVNSLTSLPVVIIPLIGGFIADRYGTAPVLAAAMVTIIIPTIYLILKVPEPRLKSRAASADPLNPV